LKHAYSLIGAYKVYNTDGTLKADLFKIRNPHGYDYYYNGTWNDGDSIWNTAGETYKEQVNFSNSSSDGVYYMTKEDFATYYYTL